jgi:hypothetical protein
MTAKPQVGMYVKPLKWEVVSPNGDDEWLQADTPFGAITITCHERFEYPWMLEPFREGLDSNYKTEEAAKEAAENDWIRRIAECVTPVPQPSIETMRELTESALMAYSETQPDEATRMARMIAPISELDALLGSPA